MILTLALLPCFCLAQGITQQEKPEPVAPVALTNEGQEWVGATLKGLSLEEKIGQMLQVRCFEDYPSFDSKEYRSLRDQLNKNSVGSVVLGVHINQQGLVRKYPTDVAGLTNQLQRDSKLPLLIAADLERGVASRLKAVPDFPWPMAFGAAGSPIEAQHFGAITAQEACAVGIHWALAPVADVNSNPANPVINDRSFGEDPARVGDMVAAFIRGAHENGMLVTAKHFPGNGDTSIDSHRAIALIPASLEHLQKVEFPAFREAIASGVDAILLAHARVPALDPDPEKITTISAKVVSGLLKDRLEFKGVVLTDALEMLGVTKLYDPQKGSPAAQAAVEAVKAGCDVIMVPTDVDEAFHAIIKSVQSGQIPESRIDDSVRKILKMKVSVGLNRARLVDPGQAATLTERHEDFEFAQHVTDEAVTLVRHNGRVLPLNIQTGAPSEGVVRNLVFQAKRAVTAIVLGEALEGTNGRTFEWALKSRCPGAEVFYFDGRLFQTPVPEIFDAMSKAEKVVVAAYVTHRGARQVKVNCTVETSFGLLGPSGDLLQQILGAAREKTAVVAFGSPYLIESFPDIQTYICTYAMASTSEISAVKALFGEIENHAKLPVTLPGVAPRGFALPWPTKQSQQR